MPSRESQLPVVAFNQNTSILCVIGCVLFADRYFHHGKTLAAFRQLGGDLGQNPLTVTPVADPIAVEALHEYRDHFNPSFYARLIWDDVN